MGIYLSSAKTEKSVEVGSDEKVDWVAMGMQGNEGK